MTLPPSVRQAGSTSLLLLAALALVGCGAAPPPAARESVTLSTAEGSLAALDQAEGELMLALGGRAAPLATGSPAAGLPAQQGPYAQPPPPPPADAPPAPPQPVPTSPGEYSASVDDAGRSTLSAGDPCSSACRALTSMRRATDRLCGLSGEGDERCQGARRRVEGAIARVRSSCPACSAAAS